MHIQSVRLQNVKCFEDVDLRFQTCAMTGDRQSNWNVILGDNGDGKTSLLQAIAACLVDSITAERLIRPDNWVRKGNPTARITALLSKDDADIYPRGRPPIIEKTDRTIEYLIVDADQELAYTDLGRTDKRFFPRAAIIEPSPAYIHHFDNKVSLIDDVDYMKRNAFAEREHRGWISCGYGAFRRISGFARDTVNIDGPLQKRFLTLFDEGAALYDCDAWLKELDRKAAKSKQGSSQREALDEVERTLLNLLPDIDEIVIADEVRFMWRGGTVDLHELSDGYRSMFALVVDLLRWLEMLRPPEVALRDVTGIVLIDEVDSHLHPRWQREAGFMLTKTFPNIQFIVTTHSPFVAMAAGKGALTLLESDGKVVTANQDVPSARGWAVDRVLTELFAMASIRDPETEQKLQRYEQLRFAYRADSISEAERSELADLEAELNARMQDDPASPRNTQMDQDLHFFAQSLRERTAGNR